MKPSPTEPGGRGDFQSLLDQARVRLGGFDHLNCGRYAPSPTGPLHLGNLRTALLAWLQARLAGGRFILRMEDLDQPRVKQDSSSGILADLRWLGLDWDEGPDCGGPVGPYLQSERTALYQAALDFLRERELVFPCYCSRKDIAEAASAPHIRASVYPGTCRVPRMVAGRTEAWRFKLSPGYWAFEDQVLGSYGQDLQQEVGDFVVRRADRLFAYQLAVVVDDGLMGVSDVVRGQDLLDSSPRQIALFEVLGLPVPRFWHVPLMQDDQGMRLSKREGSESVSQFRDRGLSPEWVVGQLAGSLGLVEKGESLSARALLESLDLAQFRSNLRCYRS